MTTYATPADMINAFDSNILGDVCSDNGTAVDEAGLATNSKLLSALVRASGEVEASCLAGAMYSVGDLLTLTGNAQGLLVDIVCCVAMCKLLRRRPSSRTEDLQKGVCGEAKECLEQLRKGQAVFGGTSNAAEGQLPSTTGPTTVTFDNLHMMRDRVQNYYPRRVLPNGRN